MERAASDPAGPSPDSEVTDLAAAALCALTRASRACLLYDFDNDAVADFLGELHRCMERALVHGPLALTVHPWELLCSGEVVYAERDREKSLAFRLYNDGVRSLTIQPAVTWDEITRLVGILSVRYSEVRLQEDDVVTMLWKASFEHVTVHAVDSYAPVDGEEGAGAAASTAGLGPAAEDDWLFDAPAPRLPDAAVGVAYRAISDPERALLLAEDEPASLPASCLRLLRALLAAATDPDDPLELELITPLVREVRDFLLGEGDDAALLEAVRLTHDGARVLPDSPQRAALLGAFTEREAFARMLDAAVAGATVPEALVGLASLAPVDELAVMLQVLASRWSGAGRTLGRAILGAGVGRRLLLVADQVLGMPPTILDDVLQVAAERDPELATTLAIALLKRPDSAARRHAVAALQKLPYHSEVGRALTERALVDDDLEVAGRAAAALAANRERRATAAVSRALEKGLARGRSAGDLAPLAAALAQLDQDAALELCAAWTGRSRTRDRAAESTAWELALGVLPLIPGEEAARQLASMHDRSRGALRARCAQAVARQREEGHGGR